MKRTFPFLFFLLLTLTAKAVDPYYKGNGAGLTNINPANLTALNMVSQTAVFTNNASIGLPSIGVGVLYTGVKYFFAVGLNDQSDLVSLTDTNGNSLVTTNIGTFIPATNTPALLLDFNNNFLGDTSDSQVSTNQLDITLPANVNVNMLMAISAAIQGNLILGVPLGVLNGGTGTANGSGGIYHQSNNWTASQAFWGTNYFYNTNVYIFAGTITAASGSQIFTAATGTFAGLVPGVYFICTNGGSSVSQYRVVKVRDNTHVDMDVPASTTYTAIHATQIFPPTAEFFDLNGNWQGSISQDASISISGIANDGTANSGRFEMNNGTNTIWMSTYNDSVDNWFAFQSYNIGWSKGAIFKMQTQAPNGSLTIDTNGNMIAGVSIKTPTANVNTLTVTNTLTIGQFGYITNSSGALLLGGLNGSVSIPGTLTVGSIANTGNFVNPLIIGNATNTATGTLIQTNFVSGKLYTNIYGRPILLNANATLTTTGVSGNASLSLLASGYLTNQFGMSTIVTSIAMSYTNVISMVVPASQTYTFTNTSTGAGDSASVLGGQILVY